MSHLTLYGRMAHADGKKYIQFVTGGGTTYTLPVVCDWDAADGMWVGFRGQLRTNNFIGDDGLRHKRWFADGVLFRSVDEVYRNELMVSTGTIVKLDTMRTTPLTNRRIVDFVVAEGDNYFNCIAFGSTADMLLNFKKVGDMINIYDGMFQSRDYDKLGETKTAYEVCVRHFV